MNQKENPFLSLGINIILPVLILNKAQKFFPQDLSPALILLLALAFPFLYGFKDFITKKTINFMSVVGIISVALTGGFALLKLKGIYFAIKEAAVPLIFAVMALGSIFLKRPLVKWFLFKSSLFDSQLIKDRLELNYKVKDFEKLMNHSTLWLTASFVLSAILNFFIALFVFTDVDSSLDKTHQAEILNKQVADMTWMGYVFIAIPLTIVTGLLMFWIVKKLKLFTGLSFEQMLSQQTLKKP